MKLPDDRELSEAGALPEATGDARVMLIACGAIAREVLALIEANGWTHLALACLPAKLHLHPGRIVAAVEEAVLRHRAAYDGIFVLYADCGTGGLLGAKCRALGVEMLEGPHCYSFFEGNRAFAARGDADMTAFYLTDFLVRQFDAFVWKPMGLDRHPELRDTYFSNYTKLVYQAQTEDAALRKQAREHAARLGLAFEYRFTGYGDLAASLRDISL